MESRFIQNPGIIFGTKINTNKISITNVLSIIKDWTEKYPSDKKGDLVFQNKEYLLNVFFNNKSMNALKHNPNGMENLPGTIQKPDELWAKWQDVNSQKLVIMHYICYDNDNAYIVRTLKGEIEFATLSNLKNLDKYRQGILFMK
jgi:hypothetical protein